MSKNSAFILFLMVSISDLYWLILDFRTYIQIVHVCHSYEIKFKITSEVKSLYPLTFYIQKWLVTE